MNEILKMISYMLYKDPLVIAGFLLIGVAGTLLVHIQLKMVKRGYKFPYRKYLAKRNFEVPRDYLRMRTQYGWSPWPAYLIWPAAALSLDYFNYSWADEWPE